ncbi:MAG: 16S rRNA (cytosine(1402)-N(4))-methyltransferase RsmH [Candidatus Omnitrophica bacterium]|nr:16S rRNA (cytosine(1402)-N(4))-methyltransferase RsmH [Candidatus Omnitrophota bacterium]MDD5488027.1 16S rRNA (cytosine(1402)-N(4))-methyltransferase RsmH [Candidatus Omnitrophota bacterium]
MSIHHRTDEVHIPVLLEETVGYLDPVPGETMLDGTLGAGGHAEAILKRIMPGGRLIGFDRDGDAIERVKARLKGYGEAVTFVNDDFRNIGDHLGAQHDACIDGAVLDLGVSSYHLEEGERGFSFLKDGPLDMRFDKTQRLTARDVVNTSSTHELEEVIRAYGEERHAKLVAKEIIRARGRKKIETTYELVDVVKKAIGSKYRGQRLHAAARTFQALRIYVNDELGALERGLDAIMPRLNPGGRIAVISFHSLEDRIVKNIFRARMREGSFKVLTKKPLTPSREETTANPRSRSAKLRVAEKVI